jgi:nucleoid DNA-binding protein
MMTYGQQVKRIADDSGIAQVDVKYVLDHYASLAANEISNGNRFRILGLVQVESKLRPAQPAREGRNPRTGESVLIEAKPATVAVKARVLQRLKDATPAKIAA